MYAHDGPDDEREVGEVQSSNVRPAMASVFGPKNEWEGLDQVAVASYEIQGREDKSTDLVRKENDAETEGVDTERGDQARLYPRR